MLQCIHQSRDEILKVNLFAFLHPVKQIYQQKFVEVIVILEQFKKLTDITNHRFLYILRYVFLYLRAFVCKFLHVSLSITERLE